MTNFHPESSCTPSSIVADAPDKSSRLMESSRLYLCMSLLKARKRIETTVMVKKITIIAELMRENQWILGSKTCKYLSHRVAQAVGDSLQYTL